MTLPLELRAFIDSRFTERVGEPSGYADRIPPLNLDPDLPLGDIGLRGEVYNHMRDSLEEAGVDKGKRGAITRITANASRVPLPDGRKFDLHVGHVRQMTDEEFSDFSMAFGLSETSARVLRAVCRASAD